MQQDLSEENIRNNCPHCDITSRAFEFILKETKGFVIVHDANPLEEGHLLIIPKKHLSCIGEYPISLLDEFKRIYYLLGNHLKNIYGSIASFEHGITGQTVFHSHVHLLPFSGKPSSIVPEGEGYLRAISGIGDLPGIFEKEKKYLFFSIGDDNWTVDTSLGAPRFFRDRFAKALGVPERANWKITQTNPAIRATMLEDVERFKKKWGKIPIRF